MMTGDVQATDPPKSSVKRWLIGGAKLAVTLGLCWLIIGWIDWPLFVQTLQNADYGLMIVVWVLACAAIVVSAWKWRILLLGHGIDFSLVDLSRWYFTAAFFNAFLPTNIGGDGYRLLKTYDNPKGKARALSAQLLERMTGVIMLGGLGYLCALIVWWRTGNALAGSLAVVGTISGIGTFAMLLLVWRVGLIGPLGRIRILRTIVDKSAEVISDWLGQTERMAAVMALSLTFHVIRIGFIWLLIYALGTPVDPVELTVALFAVEVAAMLPISIGGIGVMEGSFVYVMGSFGLNSEAGLAAMLVLRVLTLLLALIGAVLYLAEDKVRPVPVKSSSAASL